MKARWGLVVAFGVTASVGVVRMRANESPATISADRFAEPTPISMPVEESAAEKSQAGLMLPLGNEPSARRVRRAEPRSSLPLDYVEPWTGEDLEPAIVAARQRQGIDRTDPWDPSVIHPVGPVDDDRIDREDPWGGALSATRKAGPKHAKLSVEKTSPWAEAEAAPVITSL